MALASSILMSACSSDSLQAELDSLFQSVFPEGEPGAAVLVMKGDDVVYDKGFGIADLETGALIDGNTFFNIASCSKQFTAVSALQLVSSGKISLDDPVGKYFPEYTDPLWQKVTVGHLLSHSSGIPDLRGYLTREQKIAGDEDLATEYLSTLDHLNFEPGTDYEYINPTFVLVGKLVERVSGEEFTSYVHDNVFVPSGMDKTLYFDRYHQELIPNMAHAYEYEDVENMPEERTASSADKDQQKNWYEYDFGEETFFATRPDGGIYSSTHELVSWEKSIRASKVLDKDLFDLAFTPRTRVEGSTFSDYQNRPGTWYGYGWFIEPQKGCIYHTGDNGGFKILVARYPESKTLLLILANRADWDRNEVKIQAEKILGL